MLVRDNTPDDEELRGVDLLEDGASVFTDDGTDVACVPLDELDTTLQESDCDHVYRIDDKRLVGIEPAPGTGVWKTCPRCSLILERANRGELPSGLNSRV